MHCSTVVPCSPSFATQRYISVCATFFVSLSDYYRGTPDSAEMTDLRLISGSAHPALAAEIAGYLGLPLTNTTIRPFTDGEIGIQINENVRETHVFVIAPVSKPVNDSLVELLLLVATLRRSSAAEITAVIPYFGYCRQDRKMTSRVPISAADVALMLDEMGVDRVISVDLHTGQIQGFFPPRIAVENLEAVNIGALYFSEKELKRPVIIAPSSGSVPRAKKFREVLSDKWQGGGGSGGGGEVELAMLIERQYHDIDEGGRLIGVASQLDLVGEVADRDVIMVEDIVDTANTLTRAALELKRKGARNIYAFASHGLFSDNALTKIKQSPLTEVVVTNTVPLAEGEGESGGKVTQLTLAPLLAETIKRIHLKESILSLFDVHGGAAEGGEEKTKAE